MAAGRSDDERAQIAHVLRRCGFGAPQHVVEAWAGRGVDELIDYVLADTEPIALDPADIDRYFPLGDDDDDLTGTALAWMFDRMVSGDHLLHERMTWYWQTHLTSSVERSHPALMWRQHHLIRRHALGHFPTLLREITTDAAMLLYLDGSDSFGDNPNENHARELLELFALGRDGGYGEGDVRAAARIMAGWWVDWETGEVHFDEQRSYTRPVTFMGERRRWDLDGFIEFVCAQPACARHVTTRIWHHLVGPDLPTDRLARLATGFADSGMQIGPLVADIVRSPEFRASIRSRPRQPLEWLVAAHLAIGAESAFGPDDARWWWFELLGQVPWLPPNVAGWPLDGRWAGASQVVTRTSILLDWELPESLWDDVAPTADAVLARCGIYDPSEATRDALAAIEADVSEYDGRLELLVAATLVSPEFSLL